VQKNYWKLYSVKLKKFKNSKKKLKWKFHFKMETIATMKTKDFINHVNLKGLFSLRLWIFFFVWAWQMSIIYLFEPKIIIIIISLYTCVKQKSQSQYIYIGICDLKKNYFNSKFYNFPCFQKIFIKYEIPYSSALNSESPFGRIINEAI